MDWDTIAETVSNIVTAIEPEINIGVAIVAPEASAGLSIAEKLLQAALDGVPTAVALVTQITSGTPATAAQVQQANTDCEAAYQKAKAALTAALAKTN